MSSLRKATPRKAHKERSQPAARQKLGLLEKKKDYQLRAKDFHRKQDFLTKLRRKAQLKNPDEFYFGMINAKVSKGAHIKQRTEQFDHTSQLLMKSQDQSYIQLHTTINEKKIERMKESIHIVQGVQGNHTIFVDDEQQIKDFTIEKHFNTVPELASNSFNRLQKEQLESMELPEPTDINRVKKQRTKELQILSNRIDKSQKLKRIQQELSVQKNLMGKGAKKKVGVDDLGLPVYRWLPRRKR